MSDSLWPPWIAAHQVSLSITNSQRLLKLMSIESVMPSNNLIPYHSLLVLLQSFTASGSFPMSQLFASCGQRHKKHHVPRGTRNDKGATSLREVVVYGKLSSFQFSNSVMSDSLWPPWTAAHQVSLSITNSQRLLKLMSIESVMPSNNLIPYHSLLVLPSIIHSFRIFSNESVVCIMWPEYWSFSFSIRPFNEYSGLISFRNDRFDLLAVWKIPAPCSVESSNSQI